MSTVERLKALLRSLLEAFLGSKKAWVSNQAFSQPGGRINISISSGKETHYTAPTDGVVSCAIADSSNPTLCAVRLTSDAGEQISCQNNSGAAASVFLSVRKGSTVTIHPLRFSTLYFCYFFPSVGSV